MLKELTKSLKKWVRVKDYKINQAVVEISQMELLKNNIYHGETHKCAKHKEKRRNGGQYSGTLGIEGAWWALEEAYRERMCHRLSSVVASWMGLTDFHTLLLY